MNAVCLVWEKNSVVYELMKRAYKLDIMLPLSRFAGNPFQLEF